MCIFMCAPQSHPLCMICGKKSGWVKRCSLCIKLGCWPPDLGEDNKRVLLRGSDLGASSFALVLSHAADDSSLGLVREISQPFCCGVRVSLYR